MSTSTKKAQEAVRAFALGLPGAREDFPWGESVAKVGKKVFVFLGRPGDEFGIAVKLPESGASALELPFVEPTGYGLGKSGWVNATFKKSDEMPVDLLCEWIVESYRAVAPKRLAKTLDSPDAAAAPAPKKSVSKKPLSKKKKSAARKPAARRG